MYNSLTTGDSQDKRFFGIYRGVVADTADPLSQNRIRMLIPQILGEAVTSWAYSINNTSPNVVGTGVWAMFEGGDPNFPLWLGAF
jgi:hypothetical protein